MLSKHAYVGMCVYNGAVPHISISIAHKTMWEKSDWIVTDSCFLKIHLHS